MLSHLAVNSFEGFGVDRAKHFVPCTPDGYVIGDVILFHLAENTFNLVGRAPALNWITYHAETGGYDVEVELDQRWALRTDGRRRSYRFQVQGPNAMQVIEKLLGGPPPDLKFFHMRDVTIAGKSVRALRHGMAGQPGLGALRAVGRRDTGARSDRRGGSGLRAAPGRRARLLVQHARVGLDPVTAARGLHGRRADRLSRVAARGGLRGLCLDRRQLRLRTIEDYYFTPWDLGYGSFVKFDHDFIGREALERMAEGEHRNKVTLALDDEDVMRTVGTMLQKTDRAKFIEWPSAVYSMHPFDRVKVDGKTVGVSTWVGYSANEGKMLTLAILDAEHAEPGSEVTFVWGEENGGTSKPTVERHKQVEIRAIVSPVPYVETVRARTGPTAGGRRRCEARWNDELRDRLEIRELVERWVVWRDAGRLGAVPHGLARRRPHDGDLDAGNGRRVHRDEQGRLGEGRPDPPCPRRPVRGRRRGSGELPGEDGDPPARGGRRGRGPRPRAAAASTTSSTRGTSRWGLVPAPADLRA